MTIQQLDMFLQAKQLELVGAYDVYNAVTKKLEFLSRNPIVSTRLGKAHLPCVSKYLYDQAQLFASTPFDQIQSNTDVVNFKSNFYGFVNNKQRFDQTQITPQCSIVAQVLNFSTQYNYYVVNQFSKYATIPAVLNNIYVAVNGSNVDMYVDGVKVDSFDYKEFVFVNNTAEIYFESTNYFEVQQFLLSTLGDYQHISGLPHGLLQISFNSYVNVPVKIWDEQTEPVVVFPHNNTYRFNYFSHGNLNIMHITELATQIEKYSCNIFRNLAWL